MKAIIYLDSYPCNDRKHPKYDAMNKSISEKMLKTFVEVENSAKGFNNIATTFRKLYDKYGFTDDERIYLNSLPCKSLGSPQEVDGEILFGLNYIGSICP